MKFYLCETPAGARYARTQAEAKALDPKFKLVDYPTDQAALVERFNTLLASTGSTAMGELVTEPEPAEIEEAPPKVVKTKAGASSLDWQAAPEPGSCKRCIGMSDAARQIEGIMAATNIEHALSYADEMFLARIAVAIEDRRRELYA